MSHIPVYRNMYPEEREFVGKEGLSKAEDLPFPAGVASRRKNSHRRTDKAPGKRLRRLSCQNVKNEERAGDPFLERSESVC